MYIDYAIYSFFSRHSIYLGTLADKNPRPFLQFEIFAFSYFFDLRLVLYIIGSYADFIPLYTRSVISF